jgi:hypothetical protein
LFGNTPELDADPGILDYTEGLCDAYGHIAVTIKELLGKG